jgi:hypothetical protein
MVVGQILLTTMLGLKRATGPAVGAVLPLLPTIFYRYKLRRMYLRAFEDAALLQTSLLVRAIFMALNSISKAIDN